MLRPALLEARGRDNVQIHDFLVPEGRQALNAALQQEGLDKAPPDVARVIDAEGFFITFIGSPQLRVVLTGHPPKQLLKDALTLPDLPSRLLLGQEDMHSEGTRYELWDFKQRIASFPLNTPLRDALVKSGMLPGEKASP
ncbi:MAG: hypothetical protein Q7R39_18845 [Dehalococcoidia bacterium]|nr:hypothetical protein [Dehalococcoidia bacterium]